MIENYKIINPLSVIVKCDTYLCNNYADYEVGHPVQKGLCVHYCKSCLEQIVSEAKELFDTPQTNSNANKTTQTNANEQIIVNLDEATKSVKGVENATLDSKIKNDNILDESVIVNSSEQTIFTTTNTNTLTSEDGSQSGKGDAEKNETSRQSTRATSPAGLYTCKHCGKTFKKPQELTEYRKHVMKCRSTK